MRKTKIGVCVTAVLVSILVVVATVGATVYDFRDTVANKAYQGYDDHRPADVPPDEEWELTPPEYANISTLDGNLDEFGGANGSYDFHRFVFKIYEPIQTINQLYLGYEGYGAVAGNYPGAYLYLWNYATSSWELVGYHVENATHLIDAIVTSGFSNYINDSGTLQLLAETLETKTSCPFLYVFDGSRYRFIADTNSGGGVGYSDATQTYPYRRPWPEDNVKIDGSELEACNGTYRLELAEDQDEITYLDAVRLLAIDHPKGVELYSSTIDTYLKVFPFQIYTIDEPQAPRSATDAEGRDILPVISTLDRKYTEAQQFQFDPVTIDLGDLSGATRIKLLYTSYVDWPSESDYAQRTEYLRLHPEEQVNYCPYVEIINETGDWERVSADEHFHYSQAKPRTTVLDITDWFKTDDYRIRINNWFKTHIDYIAVDTSEDEEVVITELSPLSANLYWKGVSVQTSPDGEMPLIPDFYQTTDLSGFSVWAGNFTRYGDVLPLVAETDDQFVIMHTGDSIALTFNQVPVPEGMERDYYLFSDAYFKETFVRHLLGETVNSVDPLPFHGMSYYPYPEPASYPYDDEHRAYLEEYNTRAFGMQPAEEPHHSIHTDYVNVAVNSSVLYVPDDYETIQSAVDNATRGGTIIVRDGTYPENIKVNKSLTIRSANGPATCIVSANDTDDHVFKVTEDGVNISGFTVRNATAQYKAGIELLSVSNCNISNNIAVNNRAGIDLRFADNNTILNNTASNNWWGITISSSSNNSIIGNVAENNTGGYYSSGIYVYPSSKYNKISYNQVRDNGNGIFLWDGSDNNSVSSNICLDNGYGIKVQESNGSIIYNNYFNNTHNAVDNGFNTWNISQTTGTTILAGPYLGGNYWSDYVGDDLQADGLGDTLVPYNASGEIMNGGDYLPLVSGNFITNIELTPPSPARLAFNELVNITFHYSAIEAGGVRIFVRPFTNGSLTPHYTAHGSLLYPAGTGSGTGHFTILSGAVTVDQLRFQMWNADQSALLLEFFVPVAYQFGKPNAFSLDLVTGLNLISMPINDSSILTAASLAAKLGPNCTEVVSYNATQQQLLSYISGVPLNNFAIAGGAGYFVNLNNPTQVLLTGTGWPSPFHVALDHGLNLLGMPVNDTAVITASTLATKIGTSCQEVVTWERGTQAYVSYVPGVPLNNFTIRAGDGYFVNVVNQTEVTFEGDPWDG